MLGLPNTFDVLFHQSRTGYDAFTSLTFLNFGITQFVDAVGMIRKIHYSQTDTDSTLTFVAKLSSCTKLKVSA